MCPLVCIYKNICGYLFTSVRLANFQLVPYR